MFTACLKKLNGVIAEKTVEAEHQFRMFGILGFFGFILFYFFTSYALPEHLQRYENISLRASAGALCFFLVLKDYWPQRLKPFLPIYWYFTILFTLPFFFTFMMLKNPTNAVWPLYCVQGLAILLVLVDWLSFSILALLGTLLGGLCYAAVTANPQLPDNFQAILIVEITIMGYCTLFSQRNQSAYKTKLHTMKMMAGSIAHELRTPLSAMMMGAHALARLLPFYQAAYHKAREAGIPIETIDPEDETNLQNLPQNLQTVSRNAHTMITMMLTNLSEGLADRKVEVCSMKECVDEALRIYPLQPRERMLVHWENTADFSFLGHKELTKHVVFNLLKNALYAIAAANKGKISISLKPGKKSNRLIFKDTGCGIAPKSVIHVFDRFYTKSEHWHRHWPGLLPFRHPGIWRRYFL